MTDAISAAKKGDVVFLRDYLQNCTEKEITDNHGFTLFHWAAQFNHVPVLELLKDCGVDVGKATDSGDTALHLATSFERKEAITKLLEWDLDVNCTNEHGNTPLHYACLWRNMEIAERLLRHGSQLRPLNKYGKEPLDFCDREQKEMLTELAKSFNTGLEVVPYKDEHHHGRELISYKFVKLEIPPGAVKIKDRISKGTYSDTFTGIWKERKVAVRRLRWSEKMSEKVINDWLQEAGRLWKMEDPVNSVLSIVGVIRLEGGWSIVSQHIPRGSLEEVLADSQLHLKVEQKYRMAHGIAKGLQYLHSLEDPLPYLRLNLKMCLVDSKFNVLLNVASAGFTFNTAFFPITHEPAYVAPEGPLC
ncbi:integrin-linked protein kinase-like isoform X2 [Zophobas morio]|uniref:integrin-linked protein kinase-like isoform X2 n=1 Tax=Zophobas morio TaxID=2755281 RepID=UPI003082B843